MSNEQAPMNLDGLMNTHSKDLMAKDISDHKGNYESSDGPRVPQIYLKSEGTYNFFLCPPFEKHTQDTPWGGRPYLVYKKHWNLPDEEGKKRQLTDFYNSFPWLGYDNSLNEVISKWKAKGLGSHVEEYESSTGVLLNVILLESPDDDHQQFINKFDANGKLIGAEPIVVVLDSNLTTLKFLQEQLDNKYIKDPIYHPFFGSIITMKKEKKQTKSGPRVSYTRSLIPRSPRWFDEASQEEANRLIEDVLKNRLPNLYDIQKPNNFSEKNLKDFSTRIDGILAQKYSYVMNSSSMQSGAVPDNAYAAPQNTAQSDFASQAKKVEETSAKPFTTSTDATALGKDVATAPASATQAPQGDFSIPPLPEGF